MEWLKKKQTSRGTGFVHCCLGTFKQEIAFWPKFDRPRPQPLGYIKMPGRPKKERTREAHEKPKGTKMSKVGTVIRCRKCKGQGHNRNTCDRRNGAGQFATNSTQPTTNNATTTPAPAHNAMVVVSGSQQSSTSLRKRKDTASTSKSATVSKKRCSGMGILYSERTGTIIQNPGMPSQRIVCASASAKVSTQLGGTASINMESHVPGSKANSRVNITLTSGSASVKVNAQEPAAMKIPPTKRTKPPPNLLI
uniref:CCHC-type domain-containing protein n=1 Tax=Arundo donax TaxID=35708 RepID=A0A0A9BQG1_ARUDO